MKRFVFMNLLVKTLLLIFMELVKDFIFILINTTMCNLSEILSNWYDNYKKSFIMNLEDKYEFFKNKQS